ncbi:unnamed protein product [Allacma fusca]|uniref:Uncharacterized protein n=1 Tax=Allacma fusca TaxID=39272 RepID=A0A8J2KLU9_9HEXA|nr:unnamed protein product [Allacma fusca]
MFFLILAIILGIAIAKVVFNYGKIQRKLNSRGFWISDIIILITIFLHRHVGKFYTSIGNTYGPIVHVGFGPMKLVIINGVDSVKSACRHPSLNGRAHCLYKNIIGGKGILWTDDSSQKRKFIFRNTRHFELGGKSVESNIHEEIILLFKYFDSFRGKGFSVKQAFNIPTLNGVCHRLLGQKIPHDHQKLKPLVENLAV